MRRFARTSSTRKNQQLLEQQQQQQLQQTQAQPPHSPTSHVEPNNIDFTSPSGVTALPHQFRDPNSSVRDQALGHDYMVIPKGDIAHEARPISSATDASFDFANRPVHQSTAHTISSGVVGVAMSSRAHQSSAGASNVAGGNLSRTDEIVLKHFWESKYAENAKRDLHYLKFPLFPTQPTHRDLLPYSEIYHLVKTSPGATIISLGSANGVYIGFELATNAQLHIDLDDDWFVGPNSTSITHHRVSFRPYSSVVVDPTIAAQFKAWPKPLTIEFLEEQYTAWLRDLMSPCWQSHEVRELGSTTPAAPATGPVSGSMTAGAGLSNRNSSAANPGSGVRDSASVGSARNAGSLVDDGYASEKSNDPGI